MVLKLHENNLHVIDSMPQLAIKLAVKRMLPRTETKKLMRRLKIYNGENHFHQAQNPIKIDQQINVNNINV